MDTDMGLYHCQREEAIVTLGQENKAVNNEGILATLSRWRREAFTKT